MKVEIVITKQQLEDAFSVRKNVFVEEQKVSVNEEIDEFENEATHFVLYDEGKPFGAGRFRSVDGYGKVERICVMKERRGKGAGKLIMEEIEQFAKKVGLSKLKLNAQTHAIPFYLSLGYEIASEEFIEAGIPHRTMIKLMN